VNKVEIHLCLPPSLEMKIHAFDFQSKDMIEDVYVAAVVAAVDFIW